MPASGFAAQLAALRASFEAGDDASKRAVAGELWGQCRERRHRAVAAVPWLRTLVESSDEEIVWYAADALGACGSKGWTVLRKLVSHEREFVRCKAAIALGDFGDGSRPTLGLLRGLLRHGSADERIAALKALSDIVQVTERPRVLAPLQTDLLAALEDPDPDVVSYVPDALKGAGLAPKRLIEIALSRLEPPTGKPRYEMLEVATELLLHVDPLPYLPTLLRVLKREPRLASWFVPVFAQMGPEAVDAIPILEPLAKGDSDEALRAGGALLRIAGRKAVLKKLEKRLPTSPDEIAGILCDIGPPAAPVATALARVIDDSFDEPDWDLMWALTDALAAIESPEAVAVKALRKALRHESGRVKGSALRGLAKVGPAARAALPDLRRLLGKMTGSSRKLVRATIVSIEKRTN